MTCLSVMVIMEITKNSKNTAINNLQTIVQERSQIVDNYVQESEVILSAYSKAGEVLNVLKNPENKSAIDAAQKYTESLKSPYNLVLVFFSGASEEKELEEKLARLQELKSLLNLDVKEPILLEEEEESEKNIAPSLSLKKKSEIER